MEFEDFSLVSEVMSAVFLLDLEVADGVWVGITCGREEK